MDKKKIIIITLIALTAICVAIATIFILNTTYNKPDKLSPEEKIRQNLLDTSKKALKSDGSNIIDLSDQEAKAASQTKTESSIVEIFLKQ